MSCRYSFTPPPLSSRCTHQFSTTPRRSLTCSHFPLLHFLPALPAAKFIYLFWPFGGRRRPPVYVNALKISGGRQEWAWLWHYCTALAAAAAASAASPRFITCIISPWDRRPDRESPTQGGPDPMRPVGSSFIYLAPLSVRIRLSERPTNAVKTNGPIRVARRRVFVFLLLLRRCF